MSETKKTQMDSPFMIDREALTEFALRLVAEPSLSGQEENVAHLVSEELAHLGFKVEVDSLGNVTGELEAGAGPCVLLDSHMDTVEVTDPTAWSHDPQGEISGGRLYGRGAMDMKGQLAASVHGAAALRDRLPSGRIVVSASVCEELAEGPGLIHVAERVQPDQVIICEASSLRVITAQRGRAEVLIDIEGRPAHSARPHLGINAAEIMVDVVQRCREISLPEHEVLGPGILVLTDVMSRPYPGLSVVPDRCKATYDRRTLPDESENDVLEPIQAVLEAVLAETEAKGSASIAVDRVDAYTGEAFEAPNFAPAWWVDRDAPIVKTALEALAGAGLDTDVGHWAFCTNGSGSAGRLGLPTIGFGPGDEALAHCIDEHMDLADLLAGARGYAAIAEALAGQAPEV